MRASEPDLVAVRELVEELPWPATGQPSLTRTWIKITKGPDDGWRRRRFGPRVAVPVAAALAVMVLLGATWAAGLVPSGEAPAPAAPPEVPEVVVGGSVPVDQAWAEIMDGASTATPTTLPDDAIVYVRTDGEAWNHPGTGEWRWQYALHEMWLDPLGMVPLQITRNGSVLAREPLDRDPFAVAQRRRLADLNHPTAQWLAGLPTDPAALEALLLDQSTAGGWSERHALWEALRLLFHQADLALAPPVRKAIYQVVAAEDGLTATALSVDERRLYAIGRAEGDSVQELLFDPATGRVVGDRWLYFGDAEPRPADHVMSWSVWRQAVVDDVGHTSR